MTTASLPNASRLRSWAPWLALFFAALALRCWRIDFPAEVAFDESLVGRFSSFYFSGEYYYDIHPPHLKLFYAFLAWLGGMPPGYGFPAHETPYPSSFYVVMRLFPAFCGAGLAVVVAALARQTGAARVWALAAGWAVALDSALLTESRLILNDIPLLFFGFAGWLALGRWRSERGAWRLLLGAFCLAVAASIKWTGLAFLVPPLAVLAFDFFKTPSKSPILAAAALMMVSLAWQAGGYVVHFQLLDRPARDHAQGHLGPVASQGLYGANPSTSSVERVALISIATIELNRHMARVAGQVPGHPYASRWFSWPAGWRGIYFWNDRAPVDTSRIYMLPNLAVWWTGAFGIAYLLITLLPRVVARLTKRPHREISRVDLLLAGCFLVNWLPFAFIDRPMFLYHYFPALVVSLIACARLGTSIERPALFAWGWVGLCFAFFLWMAPLTYGMPLSESALAARMLFSSWP